jgi:large subunit ribosomal protein L6
MITIDIPEKVTITLISNNLIVKGPIGEEKLTLLHGCSAVIKNDKLLLSNKETSKKSLLSVTNNSLIKNALLGVTLGYRKYLKLVGVGFKGSIETNKNEVKQLILRVGYSHPIIISLPSFIEVECPKPTIIIIKGSNLQKITNFAAQIRDYKRPEPYKGKGILYRNETITLKEGKKA